MKNIILAALIAGASVSSAFAMTSNDLSAGTRYEIQRLVPNADLNNLSASTVAQLELFFVNSDNLRSGENPSGKLQVILNRG